MKHLTILILALCISIPSFSQTKEEDIKTLFKTMKTKKTLKKSFDAMLPIIKQQMPSTTKEDKKKAEKFMELIFKEIEDMTEKMISVEMHTLYDKHFTHQEIKDLISFYNTPTGKKTIDKLPEISGEIAQISMTKYMPDFQAKISKFIQDNK